MTRFKELRADVDTACRHAESRSANVDQTSALERVASLEIVVVQLLWLNAQMLDELIARDSGQGAPR